MSVPFNDGELLYHLMEILQTHSEPHSLLQEITRTFGENWSLDTCSILVSTNDPTKSYLASWTRELELKISDQSLKAFFTHLNLENKAQENWPIVINSTENWPFNYSIPLRSILGSRMIFRENVNGFILLGYQTKHNWTSQEVEKLNKLRDILAIACFIIQSNQSTPTVRQSLLRKWYEETQQQIVNNKNLLELQEQIITMLSDRVRNPLAAIKMAVKMLEVPNKSKEKYWTILKQATSQIEELFNGIKILRNIKTQELIFNGELIILEKLLQEIAESFQSRWQSDQRKQLQLILEIQENANPLSLYSDTEHLKAILVQLLTNAENFSTYHSQVYLKLTEDENQIYIELTNQGLEISSEDLQYIFDPFRRGSKAIEKAIPGIGIGLTLVKGLVDYLGGRIEVNSHLFREDDYDTHLTSFILSFPK